MVFNSRTKPGGLPISWPGTSRLEKPVRALCNIVVVDEVAGPRVLTEFATLVVRPPYVILLRVDWAEVR